MYFRTDLAFEERETFGKDIDGTNFESENIENVKVSRLKIHEDEAARLLNKEKGEYITIEVSNLTDDFKNSEGKLRIIAEEIRNIIPEEGLVLIIGIGNSEITPDAFGPKAASMTLATRHISGEIAKSLGLDSLRPVAVLSPGVLGQTGIEVGEIILSLVKKLNPSTVIAIDALASRKLERLGCTIQISNTGISPGSGIGNRRMPLNESTLGIPVIGIGVPTVVDAVTLASDVLNVKNENEFDRFKNDFPDKISQMIVTPREIDLLIERASKLTAMAINCALHPDFSIDDLLSIIS